MNRALRNEANKLRSKWRKVVTGNESKRVRDHIRETEEQPRFIKLFDKVAFTLGVLNICACQFFLLNRPEFFWLWYAVIIPVLIFSRFYHFRCLGWQYFMIDFCYFVLGLTMINIFLVHNSPLFFKVCFIYANGPLTVAILIWRNSFIFHDYDKIVSVYIHLLPSMLYYTLRWHSHNFVFNSNNSCFNSNCEPLTMFDFVVATLGYFFWQWCYIVKTEVLDKQKLDTHPELLTSLRWMSSDTKNSLAKTILRALRRVGVFGPQEEFNATSAKTKGVFVLSQLLITVVAFLPTPLFYWSSACHLLYIVFIFTVTIFNGASFYIEVFSKRYQLKIARIEEMHRIAQEASSMIQEIAHISAVSEKIATPLASTAVTTTGKPSPLVASAGSGSSKDEGIHKDQDESPPSAHSAAADQSGSAVGEDSLEAISRDLQRTSERALASMRDHQDELQCLLSGRSHPFPGLSHVTGVYDAEERSARSYSNDSAVSDAELLGRSFSFDERESCSSTLDADISDVAAEVAHSAVRNLKSAASEHDQADSGAAESGEESALEASTEVPIDD